MRSTWARPSGCGGLRPWVRATSSVERSGPVSPGCGWAIGLKKPTFSPARSRVRTSPRLMEVRPTPKSVGAIKKVCMRIPWRCMAMVNAYARTNQYGFLESPYRVVKDALVTDEIVFLSAIEEADHVIAQASATMNDNKMLIDELVAVRHLNEFTVKAPEDVTLMDVSPKLIT